MQEHEIYFDEGQRNYLPEVSARKERSYRMAWKEETEYMDPETVVHQILKNKAATADQDQICILQMDTKMRVIREKFYTRRDFQHVMAKPADFLRDVILCAPIGLIAVCISSREVPGKKEEMAQLKFRDLEYYREKKRYDDVTLKTADRSAKQLESLCGLAGVKLVDFILTDDQRNEIYSFRDQERLGKEPDRGWIEEISGSGGLSGFSSGDPAAENEPVQRGKRQEEIPVKLAWHQCEYAEEAINTPEAAIRLIQELIQDSDRERLGVINFSGRHPVNFSVSAVGQSDFVMADPKLLLRTTILSGADTVVLFHNHPSGHLEPSAGDYEVTERVGRICRLCGITLADHVIAAFDNEYCYSFYKGGKFHAISGSPYRMEGENMQTEKETMEISENELRIWTEQEDCYAIYQICADRMVREDSYAFMGMDFIKKHNMEIRGSDYHLVYSGLLKPEEALESLYVRFNLDRPEDFRGHSMSVSDVVILKRSDEVKAYYVDSCGFTELSNFVEERREIACGQRHNTPLESAGRDWEAKEGQNRNQQPVRRKR